MNPILGGCLVSNGFRSKDLHVAMNWFRHAAATVQTGPELLRHRGALQCRREGEEEDVVVGRVELEQTIGRSSRMLRALN